MSDRLTKRPNEIDHDIGLRLRKWRLAQDVDACVLAKKIGVTYQQLQKYEKGLTRIPASRLYEIAQALCVPVQWFYSEATSDGSTPTETLKLDTADDLKRPGYNEQ